MDFVFISRDDFIFQKVDGFSERGDGTFQRSLEGNVQSGKIGQSLIEVSL